MKKTLYLILCLMAIFATYNLMAQAPTLQWQKNLGGTNDDRATCVKQTADAGYILAGYTNSTDGDVANNHGGYDFWVVKLDAGGNMQWQKALGGTNDDEANAVAQTKDGGYIVAGYTKSVDGDVTNNQGGSDFWVVKLDSSGNLKWEKAMGGLGTDIANAVTQTFDGGYIVAGQTESDDGDVTGNHNTGVDDFWVVKLDTVGNIKWERTLGGTDFDYAYSIQQTADSGYIVAGETQSNNGDVTGNHGGNDYWVVKLDGTGSLAWQKTFGGSGFDAALCVQQTTDSGYVVAGVSNSINGQVTGNHGSYDYWVVKMDTAGNLQWQTDLGGESDDYATAVQQTADGGFIVAGYSNSVGGNVSGNHGNNDYWIAKLDASGSLQWQKCLGGEENDYCFSIRQTSDSGYIAAGGSFSGDGDVSGNHGGQDFWVAKLYGNGITGLETMAKNSLLISPDPAAGKFVIADMPADSHVIITDITGKVVYTATFNYPQATINTAGFVSGIYFIRLESKGNITNSKIVIQ